MITYDERLLEQVLKGPGYDIKIVQQSLPVELIVRSEWVPLAEEDIGVQKRLNETLVIVENTEIILSQVYNREDDIYFMFDLIPNLNNQGGRFVYNRKINSDGSLSYHLPERYKIINSSGENVDYGQYGFGSKASFGFAIEMDQIDAVKEGFSVEYSGLILYEYRKK